MNFAGHQQGKNCIANWAATVLWTSVTREKRKELDSCGCDINRKVSNARFQVTAQWREPERRNPQEEKQKSACDLVVAGGGDIFS